MAIREGKRSIDKSKLTKYDIVLESAWHYTQKNNTNIDGSSNMVWTPEWRRFNQCMISSTTAFGNGLLDYSEFKQGHVRKKLGYLDEKAVLVIVGNFKSDSKQDNDERFLWAKHRDLINQCLESSFISFPGAVVFRPLNDPLVLCKEIDKGIQVELGICLGEHGGHIVTVIGYRLDSKGKLIGLWLADPAGVYTEGYGKDLDGFMSFLPVSVFPKVFARTTQYMTLA